MIVNGASLDTYSHAIVKVVATNDCSSDDLASADDGAVATSSISFASVPTIYNYFTLKFCYSLFSNEIFIIILNCTINH